MHKDDCSWLFTDVSCATTVPTIQLQGTARQCVKALAMFIDAQKAFPLGGDIFGLGGKIFSFADGRR